jgi:hypothetical protein
MCKRVVFLFLAILLTPQAHADDYGFETTARGIADGLTSPAPAQPMRTRSMTRSFGSNTRTLKVVKIDQGNLSSDGSIVTNWTFSLQSEVIDQLLCHIHQILNMHEFVGGVGHHFRAPDHAEKCHLHRLRRQGPCHKIEVR